MKDTELVEKKILGTYKTCQRIGKTLCHFIESKN
jgi:hypothetical protein